MFGQLAEEDMPWEQVVLYQVDERIASVGDPDRRPQVPANVPPGPAQPGIDRSSDIAAA